MYQAQEAPSPPRLQELLAEGGQTSLAEKHSMWREQHVLVQEHEPVRVCSRCWGAHCLITCSLHEHVEVNLLLGNLENMYLPMGTGQEVAKRLEGKAGTSIEQNTTPEGFYTDSQQIACPVG